MARSGLALCLGLLVNSVAHAGATITLIPQTPGETFAPDSVVQMGIFLAQDPEGAAYRGLRLVQFDFSQTNPALVLGTTTPPPRVVFNNTLTTNSLGTYFADRELPVVSLAYTGTGYPNGNPTDPFFSNPDEELEPWNTSLIVLPSDGTPVRIANVAVKLPSLPGNFVIDAVNANAADPNIGATVVFGFGTTAEDPIVTWRANAGRGAGVPELTDGKGLFYHAGGGQFAFVPEPATLALLAVGGLVALRRRFAA